MSQERARRPVRLVDYLQDWRPFVVSRPAAQLALEPVRLRKAADAVTRRLGDVVLRTPTPFDLETIARAIREAWSSQRSLSGLSPRNLRMAPWVFFLGQNPNSWIAQNPELIAAWLAWLRGQPRPRPVLALLRACLQHYPRDLPVFERMRKDLRLHLERGSGPRLARWRERCARFGLLEPDGPSVFARTWWDVDASFESYLAEAGLAPGLESSEFVRLATQELLGTLEADLRRRCTAERLRRGLAWLAPDGGKLRFEALRIATAKALLGPFLERTPDAAIQQAISESLGRAIGDPRSQRQKWAGVPEEIRNVLLRWLVAESIEDFLKVVRATADPGHWEYREAFWTAYLRREVISDAWIVLGRDAARLLHREFESAGSAAKLVGPGIQANHSVLILRIGDLIVADWSHSGKCRIWRENDRKAPKLYAAEYTREQLTAGDCYEKAHMGSEAGSWQEAIQYGIAKQTGIRIPRSEYMPQRRRRR